MVEENQLMGPQWWLKTKALWWTVGSSGPPDLSCLA